MTEHWCTCARHQNWNQPKLQTDKIHREYTANGMDSSFPIRWPLNYLNLTRYYIDTKKVKTVQKLTQKHATQRTTSEVPP